MDKIYSIQIRSDRVLDQIKLSSLSVEGFIYTGEKATLLGEISTKDQHLTKHIKGYQLMEGAEFSSFETII